MFLPSKVIGESLLGKVSEAMTHHLSTSLSNCPSSQQERDGFREFSYHPIPAFLQVVRKKALVILDEGCPVSACPGQSLRLCPG